MEIAILNFDILNCASDLTAVELDLCEQFALGFNFMSSILLTASVYLAGIFALFATVQATNK